MNTRGHLPRLVLPSLDVGRGLAYKVRIGWTEDSTALYERWWPRVREEAHRLLRSVAEAGDVAQQVFTRLWERGDWLGISMGAVEKQVPKGRRRIRELVQDGEHELSTFVDGGG